MMKSMFFRKTDRRFKGLRTISPIFVREDPELGYQIAGLLKSILGSQFEVKSGSEWDGQGTLVNISQLHHPKESVEIAEMLRRVMVNLRG